MNGLILTLSSPGSLLARSLWALAIIAAGLALYRLVNHVILARAQKAARANPSGSDRAGDGLPFTSEGKPVILYFTTPGCVPCRTIQRPALARLQQQLGDRLQVVEVDATERPDLASQWGVLSVPTTFIIDARGQVRQVNHGAARVEKLEKQLDGLF